MAAANGGPGLTGSSHLQEDMYPAMGPHPGPYAAPYHTPYCYPMAPESLSIIVPTPLLLPCLHLAIAHA